MKLPRMKSWGVYITRNCQLFNPHGCSPTQVGSLWGLALHIILLSVFSCIQMMACACRHFSDWSGEMSSHFILCYWWVLGYGCRADMVSFLTLMAQKVKLEVATKNPDSFDCDRLGLLLLTTEINDYTHNKSLDSKTSPTRAQLESGFTKAPN